jgi:1,2-diacylglycerol 3-beta-glucosyltransferase
MRAILDLFGLALAIGAAIGSSYILFFAIAGSRMANPTDRRKVEIRRFPRVIVFIPAHNEENGIIPSIRSVLGMNYPRSRFDVVVIADNCTDRTAEVAALAGANVWIRKDKKNPGKGPALAWAFHKAHHLPFDLAAIIDADSEVEPEFLRRITDEVVARGGMQVGVVYQGRYDFAPAKVTSDWFEAMTVASKAAENSFVYRPRSRVGLVNLLQGNGFCIPRRVLDRVPFRSTSIVEDAEYAVTLALNGIPVCYVEEACVRARMTRTIRDAAPQRLRWASGIFRLMFRAIPKMLWCGIVRRNWKLVEAAFMLVLTSRLLLIYLTLGSLGLAYFATRQDLRWADYVLCLMSVAAQVCYVWLMCRKAGSGPFMTRRFVFLPVYLVLVALAQLASLTGLRRTSWTRTSR